MTDTREISLTINGAAYTETVETRFSLADVLREKLNLTGTHLGCEHGACGACTVLVDGEPVRSCLMLGVQAAGSEVTTVEGLAAGERLSPLQQEFRKHHGLQCGFCTPGFLTTLTAYLRDNPAPSEADIRNAISGNICRCTGYQGIVAAALDAAAQMRSG